MLTKRPAGLMSEDIRELILGYLAEHPSAADTLEGIVGWWLERQRLRVAITNVSSTLQSLIEEDVLEQVGVGNGCRYRLKPSVSGNSVLPSQHHRS